jgi:hypothetical protein
VSILKVWVQASWGNLYRWLDIIQRPRTLGFAATVATSFSLHPSRKIHDLTKPSFRMQQLSSLAAHVCKPDYNLTPRVLANGWAYAQKTSSWWRMSGRWAVRGLEPNKWCYKNDRAEHFIVYMHEWRQPCSIVQPHEAWMGADIWTGSELWQVERYLEKVQKSKTWKIQPYSTNLHFCIRKRCQCFSKTQSSQIWNSKTVILGNN